MKKIEDYLHLYLMCEILIKEAGESEFVSKMEGVQEGKVLAKEYGHLLLWKLSEVKPILRPLSDMTEEECEKWREISILNPDPIECDAERTRYLLSKHFDLFGLIEAGLAIDKTTLPRGEDLSDEKQQDILDQYEKENG